MIPDPIRPLGGGKIRKFRQMLRCAVGEKLSEPSVFTINEIVRSTNMVLRTID